MNSNTAHKLAKPAVTEPSSEEAQAKSVARIRLEPGRRKQLILDAALQEFAAHGYNATRIDDIAARAGLSKGGFYAHFTNKDEVFEALLKSSLNAPAIEIGALLTGSPDARALSERLVDALHATIANPAIIAMLRVLFTEGRRLPHVVAQWRANTLDGLYEQLAQLFRAAVAQGICRDSVVCREPWLIVAPVVHLAMQRLALDSITAEALDQARHAHVEMVCELLTPRPTAQN